MAVVRSIGSLGVLNVDSAFVALTIVFGVVVELESDSFSKLPISSLSCASGNRHYLLIYLTIQNCYIRHKFINSRAKLI